jgi:TRAP-type uncharacterized transport system fused permease subunit
MGLMPIQAHLFVFYFACIACITPPVALAAFTAAPLCQGNATKIGFIAFKLGLAAFIVPYAFVYGPALLMIYNPVWEVIIAIITAIIGCASMAIGLTGWLGCRMPYVLRPIWVLASIGLIVPGTITDIAGCAGIMLAMLFQMIVYKKAKNNQ